MKKLKTKVPALDPSWISKINAISQPSELQILAKNLTETGFLSLLEVIEQEQIAPEKLTFILAGMAPEVFYKSLWLIPESLLTILWKDTYSEPLSHHLTLVTHVFENLYQFFLKEVESLKIQFKNFKFENLTYNEIDRWQVELEKVSAHYLSCIEPINMALILCWNVGRTDLIKKLTFLKTQGLQLCTENEIFDPSDYATTLHDQLIDHLSTIFVDAKLHDEDPAIDGLAALSVWYLRDYWEAGLLRSVASIQELEPPESFTEEQKLAHKKTLFENVAKNLETIHLKTVEDLKSVGIFSKKMLREYVWTYKGPLL